ncbi:MAG: succinate dehydrogenase, cytochrome b556 subunit [Alphaproteobacteria bacterium]|nr:succinate dehydrogenase, cytochrome b556 subunit [Alphaproteobacteria bacterium]
MSDSKAQKPERPLSPHLQVYRPQMTSMTSILHRATGAALSIGLALFSWWLVAASIGPEAYGVFGRFVSSKIGLLMLLGFTIATYYHLANGIRHLFWDAGKGVNIKSAYATGAFILFFTLLATVGTWYCVIVYGGAFL